jgi:flagellar motor switch protein FliG
MLKEEHVEQVALQIANLKKVSPLERDAVMEETYQLSMAEEYISAG